MFTGIIEKTAPVASVERTGEVFKLHVSTGFSDLAPGESVAVNGVCLTVEEIASGGGARFDISEETRRRTQLGELKPGSLVNLERALTLQTRLSGHWVQGHVDGLGRFLEASPEANGYRADFEIPAALSRYCVEKGSIALDGVSLTIGELEDLQGEHGSRVRVFLIPFTWKHTRLSTLRPGDAVNVEVDVLAKYAERLLSRK
jgi:riboflavin synthase